MIAPANIGNCVTHWKNAFTPFALIRKYIPASEWLSYASAAGGTERHGTDHPILPLVQSRSQKPRRKH